MNKHVLVLMISAFILACGAIAASAQETPGTPKTQQPDHAQHHPADQGGSGMTGQGGMMGRGMMEQGGMMGRGMMGQGGMMGCGMIGQGGPFVMRIIFALIDSDGDGTVSLSEFQAAHERIFKAMDVNKDGVLSLEEMQAFMHGTGKSSPQQ
jgi:EF hand domain-containing protein